MRNRRAPIVTGTIALLSLASVSAAKWVPMAGWNFGGTAQAKLSSRMARKLTFGATHVDLSRDGVVDFKGMGNAQLGISSPARGFGECASRSWAVYIEFNPADGGAEKQVIASFHETPPQTPTYGRRLTITRSGREISVTSYRTDGSIVGSVTIPHRPRQWQAVSIAWTVTGQLGTWSVYEGDVRKAAKPIHSTRAVPEDVSKKPIWIRFGSNCAGNQPFVGAIRRIVFYRAAAGRESKSNPIGQGATQRPADKWTLQFTDNFNRAELGPNWKVLDGSWRIENGWLVGRGTILCTRKFPGSQRVEYQCASDETTPTDLSAVLSTNDRGVNGGAFFGFGSNANTCSKLLLAGREVLRRDAVIRPGKAHRIVCERDGTNLVHKVDGRKVVQFVNGGTPFLQDGREGAQVVREMVALSGEDHQWVALYAYRTGRFDKFEVYTRSDPAASIKVSKKRRADLVANSSFETLQFGTTDQPADWVELRWSRKDTVEVVADPQRAHWGRRYLRLYGPEEHPIQIHSVGGIMLTPGKSYKVRVWARREGPAPATLTVEPGRGKAELTSEWQQYVFTHDHPAHAKEKLGLFIAIRGGPAAIDDVSMVEANEQWKVPKEWRADLSKLKPAKVDRRWPSPSGTDEWRRRVPIVLSEVMGLPAGDYLVALRLGDVLPSWGYNFISFDRIKVVDASQPDQTVPSIFVNDDYTDTMLTGKDYLLFIATCPPRTRKTYYVYFANQDFQAEPFKLTRSVPKQFAKPSSYPYRLYCDVGRPEAKAEISSQIASGRTTISVRDWAGRKVSAKLNSPTGKVLDIAAVKDGADDYLWRLRLPLLDEDGIWQVQVELTDAAGNVERLTEAFASGSAIWGVSNIRKIHRWDPPKYTSDKTLHLTAARNEPEAFQVAVESTRTINSVDLKISDFVSQSGGRLASKRFKTERVEEIYITKPRVGGRAGWHPDILLPWKPQSLSPGQRRVAWITVSVPKDLPAGLYRGEVSAVLPNSEAQLPVELTVLDFTFPDRPSFTPVLGADLWVTQSQYPRKPKLSNPGHSGSYFAFDREAVIEYAHFLGRRYCASFYYLPETSPYPAPWHYDPQTKKATFDFSEFDRQVEALLQAGGKYLFVGRIKSGWREVTSVRDWKTNALRWDGWKSKPYNHIHRADTPEGLDMIRAWAEGMGRHLQEKGWLDRTYVYVVDEAKSDDVRNGVLKVARTLRTSDPPIQTFGASYIRSWLPYFEYMTAMTSTGPISDHCREEFKRRGIAYWGAYNRPNLVSMPLAIPRVTGLHGWLNGAEHYFVWASMRTQYGYLNGNTYVFAPANAGYPTFTFVAALREPFSLGTLGYPWPNGEPLPAGKTRAFAPSIRLEAMRESVEDYEYVKMLSDIVNRSPAGSETQTRGKQLINQMAELLEKSIVGVAWQYKGHKTHGTFVLDEQKYQKLRHQIGLMIEKAAGVGGN